MTSILVSSDTAPTINGTITDTVTGNPVNLANCSIHFQLRLKTDRRFLIDAVATIVSTISGQVSYDLVAADLDFSGDCYARWRVTYSNGRIQHTVPPIEVTVQDR